MKSFIDALDNQSISAFLGAFSAFLLIIANDWWRERRRVKTLRAEIEVNLSIARDKLETARRMRSMIRDYNEVMAAPVLRFNTVFTRQLASDVLHRLSLDQRRAVEALCYTMEAIDDLFSETQKIAKKFGAPLGQAVRVAAADTMLQNWADGISNLKRLIEMCEKYVAGRHSEILRKQYNPQDYSEP